MKDLGHGIYLGDELVCEELRAKGYLRFLDVLWLPVPLSQLSPEQILVINRFRESNRRSDDQFRAADAARVAMEKTIATLSPGVICEIGCGRFPLMAPGPSYVGVDIDDAALSHTTALGYSSFSPENFCHLRQQKFSIIVSLYAMHFKISVDFMEHLARMCADNSVFCFNFIADSSVSSLEILTFVGKWWPIYSVLKCPSMAKKEYFVVAGSSLSLERMHAARSEIVDSYDTRCSVAA